MTPPNTTPLNELLDRVVGVQVFSEVDTIGDDALNEWKQELTKLIQTLEKKARIDENERYHEMLKTGKWRSFGIEVTERLKQLEAELGSAKELPPNNTTTRSKE